MRFEESPPLGKVGPDFLLWPLEGAETNLSAVWSDHTYTIGEFGSFHLTVLRDGGAIHE